MEKTIKKLSTLIIGLAIAFGANAGNDADCDLDTQAFEDATDQTDESSPVTASTIGKESFGISSESQDCNKELIASIEVQKFVSANANRLARDMATGHGEVLESLAAALGIKNQHKEHFFQLTKQNFAKIFSSPTVTIGEILSSLNKIMSKDEILKQYVA